MSSKKQLPIIEINNISKKYRLGSRKHDTLRDELTGAVKGLAGKKESEGVLHKGEFWALRDISFKVNKGEILGIVGKNGSGKSTLLKILGRVTFPATGKVILRGTVASLLEVGTGFSPELTGRENVYLNGAILGMTRKEINRKFNDIVEFAEIEKFIDTPVKHYSSGMYMRLAFSVAAFLDSDIILVDEILSVGDTLFQEKSFNKMKSLVESGRTVLLVGHNMAMMRNLCQKCVLLDNGRVKAYGTTSEVLKKYLGKGVDSAAQMKFKASKQMSNQITGITVMNSKGKLTTHLMNDESFTVTVSYEVRKLVTTNNYLYLTFYDMNNEIIFRTFDFDSEPNLYQDKKEGKYQATFNFPPLYFNDKVIKVVASCGIHSKFAVGVDRANAFDERDFSLNFNNKTRAKREFGLASRPGLLVTNINSKTKREGAK